MLSECRLQTIVTLVVPSQKINEVQRVSILKCPVLEDLKSLEILFLVVQNKFMRSIIHEPKKLCGLVDNRLPLTPCEYGCPESSDLDILLLGIALWDTDGVICNEVNAIDSLYNLIEIGFESSLRFRRIQMLVKSLSYLLDDIAFDNITDFDVIEVFDRESAL